MSELKPTSKTVEAINRWTSALHRVKEAKARLNSEETELLNATNELGKWLVPDDAERGEKFHVWDGDGLIAIWRRDTNTYEAEWRKPKTTPSV